MSRLIEMIRRSALPVNMMRSAALGALSIPEAETIEILVCLAQHPIFGEQARFTLAGWDERSLIRAGQDPATPPEVLDYLSSPENLRPKLLPILLQNPAVPEGRLVELAQSKSRETLTAMLASERAQSLEKVLTALSLNHHLLPPEVAQVEQALARFEPRPATPADDEPITPATPAIDESDADILEIENEIARFQAEHAAEIAAAEAEPFELVDLTEEENREIQQSVASRTPQAAVRGGERRLSTLQKIARLSVGERVQLAMKGNREERFVLIRDGTKIVSSAVLESPKLTDSEVEYFATMKNVTENVLRGIASKRKFIKLYPVVRALCSNPRCPLDVSLTLVKSLMVRDLKDLSTNKNVADTLRKVSLKLFREKSTVKKRE
ncbi:MAG TPA: hypothetical protein VK473_04715 [Terriglobales bacterium]|nr:hypothetical protein [Terriglobales bacterium]